MEHTPLELLRFVLRRDADDSHAGASGHVAPEFIWAALDCPGAFALEAEPILLHFDFQRVYADVDPVQRPWIDAILASGRHMLALVNDVLDLSAAEAGRLELHREELDVGALVGETLQRARAAAAPSGISVSGPTGAVTVNNTGVLSAIGTPNQVSSELICGPGLAMMSMPFVSMSERNASRSA